MKTTPNRTLSPDADQSGHDARSAELRCDAQGVIVECNESAALLLCEKAVGLGGRPLSDFIDFGGAEPNPYYPKLRAGPHDPPGVFHVKNNPTEARRLIIIQASPGDNGQVKLMLSALPERRKDSSLFASLEYALENIAVAATLTNEAGRFLYVNAQACKALEYSREELLEMTVPDIDPVFPHEQWVNIWEELKIIKSSSVETRHRTRSGRIFPVLVHANYFEYLGQGFNLALIYDISQQKKTETALTESQRRLLEIIEAAPFGAHIYEIDEQGRLIFKGANKAANRILAIDHSKLIGKPILEAFPGLTGEEIPEAYACVAREGGLYRREITAYDDDGNVHRSYDVHAIQIAQNRMTSFFTDITERKHHEEALKASIEFRERVFDSSRIPIGILDSETVCFIECNTAAAEIYGHRDVEALIGKSPMEFSTPFQYDGSPSSQKSKELIAQSIREGMAVFEWRHLRPNGEIWDAEVHLMPFTLNGRQYVQFTLQDITEKKRAQQALINSEKQYRHLAETLFDGIVMHENGRVIYCNLQFAKMNGYDSPEEMIGLHVTEDLIAPEQREAQREVVRSARDVKFHIVTAMRKDGTTFPAETQATIFRQNGREIHLVVGRDITERLRMEERLRQTEKMEAVGQLAGGVAHDFNNMLSVILGHAEMTLAMMPTDSPYYANLKQIQNAAERSADLTRQLLAFARKQTVSPKTLQLNDAIEGMLKILRRLIGEDIAIKWTPAPDLWPIRIDPAQVDQIMANLLLNARDAMPGSGRVSIATHNATLRQKHFDQQQFDITGEYVELEVRDTGTGIEEDLLQHIFEPFFTTKGPGQGTGLGLATVYGAVRQNDGYIEIESEKGRGTCFRIYLPRHFGETEAIQAMPSQAKISKGQEKILLVEDEIMVLKICKNILTKLGYEVMSASNAEDALMLAEESGNQIDLLITDLIMPGQNGRELAERLRQAKPDLKCLYISGYTANLLLEDQDAGKPINFLQKPFTTNTFASKVREALDSE